jgi:DNA-binding NarL/FixJ family response regulator
MLKVLIVDDHAVVRGGLRQFFADTVDIEVAGEAASGGEALSLVHHGDWDVVLLDIGLPDLNGIEVLKRIRRVRPELPVLIFSMLPEDEFAIPALDAGAAGFLSKDSPPGQILEAIRTAARGCRYVGPALAEKLLVGADLRSSKLPHALLSKREMEVLLLLSNGMALTAIGDTLHLSAKTISTYRTRILEKFGMRSNAELTRYVLHHKLG